MAEGSPEATASVVPSGGRGSGSRRELSWAVGVLSEFSTPLSRTRSGKPPASSSSTHDLRLPEPKRKRKVSGDGGTSASTSAEAALPETRSANGGEGSKRKKAVAHCCFQLRAANGRFARSSSKAPPLRARASPLSGAALETPVLVADDKVASLIEEPKLEMGMKLDSEGELATEVPPEELNAEVALSKAKLDESQVPAANDCAFHALDEHIDTGPNGRFSRSSSKAPHRARASLIEEPMPEVAMKLDSEGEIAVEAPPEELNAEVALSTLELDEPQVLAAEECASHAFDKHIDMASIKVDNSVLPTSSETPKVTDCRDNSLRIEDENGQHLPLQPETPTRRFTRSALKSIAMEETIASVNVDNLNASKIEMEVALVCSEGAKDGSQPAEYPTWRITRSQTLAESEGAVADGRLNGDEGGSSVSKASGGSLRTTPENKMELKMSKKVVLTKVPSTVRQLLATGLLDGMRVIYITHPPKEGLVGVIGNGGILCSCLSCCGTKTISANHFKLHAGGARKNLARSICIENGKSMLDIMKSCVGAPMDMLETTIQNAISLAPLKKPVICKKCKGLFHKSSNVKFRKLCDSCLETRRLLSTPSPSIKTSVSPSGSVSNKRISGKILRDKNTMTSSEKVEKSIPGKLTKRDNRLHKLVFEGDVLPAGTEVGYYIRGKRLLEGYIKDTGIFCRCCNCVVTPSQFEAHAGQAPRKKPYNNIFTSNGVSLHELSVSLSKDRKLSMNENDDFCSICADGGELLVCDVCPRVFHVECVGLSKIPEGDWYCRYCETMHLRDKCLEHNDNAFAAGRVTGVNSIEQIFKRCIRIVETQETDSGGCVLCKCKDYGKSVFGPRTVLLCDQCEKEFHIGCLKDFNMFDLKELPEGEWFCCSDCCRIHDALQDVLLRGSETLQGPNIDYLSKNSVEKSLSLDSHVDLKWRLLCGKSPSSDCKLLLSKAVSLFHECFDPIVDSLTGRDLIPSMVYGRSMRYQDYGGMYCAILTMDSKVISACILRVLGNEIAELPLAATHTEFQGKGYFRMLFSCIERMMRSMGVKHFVLPAVDEVGSIWTKKFGFAKITKEQLQDHAKDVFLTTFWGTSMLHKTLDS